MPTRAIEHHEPIEWKKEEKRRRRKRKEKRRKEEEKEKSHMAPQLQSFIHSIELELNFV